MISSRAWLGNAGLKKKKKAAKHSLQTHRLETTQPYSLPGALPGTQPLESPARPRQLPGWRGSQGLLWQSHLLTGSHSLNSAASQRGLPEAGSRLHRELNNYVELLFSILLFI